MPSRHFLRLTHDTWQFWQMDKCRPLPSRLPILALTVKCSTGPLPDNTKARYGPQPVFFDRLALFFLPAY